MGGTGGPQKHSKRVLECGKFGGPCLGAGEPEGSVLVSVGWWRGSFLGEHVPLLKLLSLSLVSADCNRERGTGQKF